MSEPMDYAWGMLKQQDGPVMAVGGQGQGGFTTPQVLVSTSGRNGGTKGMGVGDQLRYVLGRKEGKEAMSQFGERRFEEGERGQKVIPEVKQPSRWRMAAGLGGRALNLGLRGAAAFEGFEQGVHSGGSLGQALTGAYYGGVAGGIPQLEQWADPTRRYGQYKQQQGAQQAAQNKVDSAALADEDKEQKDQESNLASPESELPPGGAAPPPGGAAPGAAAPGGAAPPPGGAAPGAAAQVPPGQTQLTQFGGSAQTQLQGTGVSPRFSDGSVQPLYGSIEYGGNR